MKRAAEKKTTWKKSNYQDALELALSILKDTPIAALNVQVERCRGRAIINEGGNEGEISVVEVRFMGRDYTISVADMDVCSKDDTEVPIFYKILILHCLLYHNGKEPKMEWISFTDIKDGLLYSGIYRARTALPLSFALKKEPSLLIDAAESLGGQRADLGGDVSVLIEPFHNIPVGVVFWGGDEDFPPEVNFLYDKGIRDILPAEDVVVLTEGLSRELRQYIKGRRGGN